MASSSSQNTLDEAFDDTFDDTFDELFDQHFDQAFENFTIQATQEEQRKKRKKRVYIERHREERHNRLWNDYFSQAPTEEYLRRPTPADLQRLLDVGEYCGFPGMIGSINCTLNDINVLDRSPVFDDIINGQAPNVTFSVNGHQYNMAYYLTDENERDGYTQFDVQEFQQGEDQGSSHVDLTYSTNIPSNIANMMGVRTRIHDTQRHQQLKHNLVEHIWRRYGGDEDNN
uniref:Uncharacterized protein n=1 Tax=Brassica oleracea var. oleracea TaxID=109376 RepID=A0A0D3C4T8_BRAOL